MSKAARNRQLVQLMVAAQGGDKESLSHARQRDWTGAYQFRKVANLDYREIDDVCVILQVA